MTVQASQDPTAELRKRACSLLAEQLGRRRQPYALIDFPNHGNVGDSAIWLGELEALRAIGMGPPRYVCDLESFCPRILRDRVGNGPVLIHGGGNFGDLWPRHQQFREHVIHSLPRNKIIQLPQSIQFQDSASEKRAGRALACHPDVTLLVRDRRSLERARRALSAPILLCPDMAFCLGRVVRPHPPQVPVLWLLRRDHESWGFHEGSPPAAVHPVDWVREERRGWVGLARRLSPRPNAHRVPARLLHPLIERVWRAAARQRLRRGSSLLASASVVVTDRLHAHILCRMMGIPHVVLPDRFGKIESFMETWGGESDLTAVARDVEDAHALASALLEGRSAPTGTST